MLVQQPAISEKTRNTLNSHSEKTFARVKPGEDLDSVIQEVLNDKDIFMFLAQHLPENKGLVLGSGEFWDDTSVFVHYGLTLDFRVPRNSSLFAFSSFDMRIHPSASRESYALYKEFPSHLFKGEINSYPTAEHFVGEVNLVLQNPRPYLINLPKW